MKAIARIKWVSLVCALLLVLAAIPAFGLFPSAKAADEFQAQPMIAAGENHVLALKSDGTVWAWGFNSQGQLGDGTDKSRSTPAQVNNLTKITAVAAGGGFQSGHSLALKSDGTVWAWGDNFSGQLGFDPSGDYFYEITPVQISNLDKIAAVSAGHGYSLALKSDGTVWAWGMNNCGQLSDGTSSRYAKNATPTKVKKLDGIIAISAGFEYSLALKSDGTVWAWGANRAGRLVEDTSGMYADITIPVQINNLTGVIAVAAGDDHSLVLKSDGTVWAWGGNHDGQLGNGSTSFNRTTTPVQVKNLTEVTAVALGSGYSLAQKSDGTAWAWGGNAYGYLGNGKIADTDDVFYRTSPIQVNKLTGVTAVAAKFNYSLALKDDGTVWAWGWNEFGQLGDGASGWGVYNTSPMQVLGENGVGYLNLGIYKGAVESPNTGSNPDTLAVISLVIMVGLAAVGVVVFLIKRKRA